MGVALLVNVSWILLMVTGEPVTEDNRSWMYGLFVFAAVAAGLLLAARAGARRIRGRSPTVSRRVVASSIATGFAFMSLAQVAAIRPNRPEVAAALQNLTVAVAATIWWLRTRRRTEPRRARQDTR